MKQWQRARMKRDTNTAPSCACGKHTRGTAATIKGVVVIARTAQALINQHAHQRMRQNKRAMDKKQENQTSMLYAVQQALANHNGAWSATPAVVTASGELDGLIDAVESRIARQVIDIRGFARDKAAAEFAMIDMTLQVAGGVRAYAIVIGDEVLAGKMNVTRTGLVRHRDSVVAQHCQGIHDEANAVVASLVGYGVTAAVLTSFQGLIDRYVAAISAPRNAITERKTATTELRTLLTEDNRTLMTRLDSLVEQFREPQPEFYLDYHHARVIVDLGTGGGEEPEEPPVPVAA